jgi:hypothetical protein
MPSKWRERERERELQLRGEFRSASQPLLVRHARAACGLCCACAERTRFLSRQALGREDSYGGTVDVRAA